jgi:hypothetical protein
MVDIAHWLVHEKKTREVVAVCATRTGPARLHRCRDPVGRREHRPGRTSAQEPGRIRPSLEAVGENLETITVNDETLRSQIEGWRGPNTASSASSVRRRSGRRREWSRQCTPCREYNPCPARRFCRREGDWYLHRHPVRHGRLRDRRHVSTPGSVMPCSGSEYVRNPQSGRRQFPGRRGLRGL